MTNSNNSRGIDMIKIIYEIPYEASKNYILNTPKNNNEVRTRDFLIVIEKEIKDYIKQIMQEQLSEISLKWFNELPDWAIKSILKEIINQSFIMLMKSLPLKILEIIEMVAKEKTIETIESVFNKYQDDIRSIKI